jgi:hypothetical protein
MRLTLRWSQRRLLRELMDGLGYTTVIELAESLTALEPTMKVKVTSDMIKYCDMKFARLHSVSVRPRRRFQRRRKRPDCSVVNWLCPAMRDLERQVARTNLHTMKTWQPGEPTPNVLMHPLDGLC